MAVIARWAVRAGRTDLRANPLEPPFRHYIIRELEQLDDRDTLAVPPPGSHRRRKLS